MDLQQTIDEIVAGSELPLSIIIVGVGNADFGKMATLDADTSPLYSQKTGKYQTRDIVQFVPFNQFSQDYTRLGKEVLREIPQQMVRYFQSKNITPNPPNPAIRQAQVQQMALNLGDTYFMQSQTNAIQKLVGMGADMNAATNFVATHGFPEDRVDLIYSNMGNPQFQNILRM